MSPMYQCTKCGCRHKESSALGVAHLPYRELPPVAKPTPPAPPQRPPRAGPVPSDLAGDAIPDDVKPTTVNETRVTGVEHWGDWSSEDSEEMDPLDVRHTHWSPNYRLEVWEGRENGVMVRETGFTPLESLVHAKKIAEARGEKYGRLRAWKDKRRLKAYKKEVGE